MGSYVDAAIINALDLDAFTARMTSHGGSGFTSTFKVTATKDGKPVKYFVKTGLGDGAMLMFRGEHASLNAIHRVVPSLCPASHAHGLLASTPHGHFLATDFLDFTVTRSQVTASGSSLSFAAKLAKLHTTPAPKPKGHTKALFGFPVTTCCGATPQDNKNKVSWKKFYVDLRLRPIARAGRDAQLMEAVETVAEKVAPRLLDAVEKDSGIEPVLCHGDLWSGNHGMAGVTVQTDDGERTALEEMVFDPSCVYGHSEYDLGLMRMFGGFGSNFWKEYKELVPPAEPSNEWDDRLSLYELYHHLNHYALFGGNYKDTAMNIMKDLIAKYGGDADGGDADGAW